MYSERGSHGVRTSYDNGGSTRHYLDFPIFGRYVFQQALTGFHRHTGIEPRFASPIRMHPIIL